MLEGPAIINPRASPSLPACVASPDPLPNAAERAPDCSLHRRVSSINGAICTAKTAGIQPMAAGNELAGGGAAAGGLAGLHGDPIDEGCRGLCRGGGGGGCNRRSGRGAGGRVGEGAGPARAPVRPAMRASEGLKRPTVVVRAIGRGPPCGPSSGSEPTLDWREL
jgi:hypothetical protein